MGWNDKVGQAWVDVGRGCNVARTVARVDRHTALLASHRLASASPTAPAGPVALSCIPLHIVRVTAKLSSTKEPAGPGPLPRHTGNRAATCRFGPPTAPGRILETLRVILRSHLRSVGLLGVFSGGRVGPTSCQWHWQCASLGRPGRAHQLKLPVALTACQLSPGEPWF
jgi:hypothetical protein